MVTQAGDDTPMQHKKRLQSGVSGKGRATTEGATVRSLREDVMQVNEIVRNSRD